MNKLGIDDILDEMPLFFLPVFFLLIADHPVVIRNEDCSAAAVESLNVAINKPFSDYAALSSLPR